MKDDKLDEKIITFGLVCVAIGIVGLLTFIGILITAMGVIPICIYVCFLFIGIGILAYNIGSDDKSSKYPF